MNLVWPISALFGRVLWPWGYVRFGRLAAGAGESDRPTPFWAKVAKGASPCGSGCMPGDVGAEWLAFVVPAITVWFGYGWLFPKKMPALWVLDYVLAIGFGIAFQCFTSVPMRRLSVRDGLWQAVKADTLPLTAWQLGMYRCMALAAFGIFRGLLHAPLETASPAF